MKILKLLILSHTLFSCSSLVTDSFVKRGMNIATPAIRACYKNDLAISATPFSGVLHLEFEISPEGKTSKVKIEDRENNFPENTVDCVRQAIEKQKFQAPKDGKVVFVNLPINIYPKNLKN